MATVEQHLPETHNGVAETGEGIAVENPATGETIATVPDLSAAAVAEMAAKGRAAQPAWEAFGFEGRARVLLRAQKWLMDNTEQVVSTIVSETGKTYEDATFAEISYGGGAFGFWAKNAAEYLADERVKSSQVLVKGKKLILRFRPLGLIGVIGPWNYPLTNSFGDCIPALAAGNSVILKPSEITPLTSLLLAEGMRECGLPENVLQIATGRGETGAALLEHVDMIMFTGSTRTGRKVAEAAARRLIPASLELGGKDPMIVLSDADLERAANFATYYSMQNAGQTCISCTWRSRSTRSSWTKSPRRCAPCEWASRRATARSRLARSRSRPSCRRSRTTSPTPCRRARACSRAATSCRAQVASTSRPCS